MIFKIKGPENFDKIWRHKNEKGAFFNGKKPLF
jgi:hypothetical protein